MIYLAWFFGGALFANSVPHLVAGISGRPFPTPFATPHGRGKSSAPLNVIWGAVNLAAAYGLLAHVGDFALHDVADVGVAGAGALLLALGLAWWFGRQHGLDRTDT